MTVDLTPYLGAVPEIVVRRLRDARCVLAVGHENPDADTLGASLAVARLVAAQRRPGRPGLADPVPPLYDFLPGVGRFPTDPDPTADYDLLVISDCGSLDRVGAVARPACRRCSSACRGSSSTTTPPTTAAARPTGSTRTRPRPARWSRCSRPGSASRLTRRTAHWPTELMGGIVMDTATFAHPNATPRTLAVSAALVEAGAPLSDISRRLYRSKPDVQLRLFGRVLDRLEAPTTAGSCGPP